MLEWLNKLDIKSNKINKNTIQINNYNDNFWNDIIKIIFDVTIYNKDEWETLQFNYDYEEIEEKEKEFYQDITNIFSVFYLWIKEKLKNKNIRKEDLNIINQKIKQINLFLKEIISKKEFEIEKHFYIKQLKLYIYTDVNNIINKPWLDIIIWYDIMPSHWSINWKNAEELYFSNFNYLFNWNWINKIKNFLDDKTISYKIIDAYKLNIQLNWTYNSEQQLLYRSYALPELYEVDILYPISIFNKDESLNKIKDINVIKEKINNLIDNISKKHSWTDIEKIINEVYERNIWDIISLKSSKWGIKEKIFKYYLFIQTWVSKIDWNESSKILNNNFYISWKNLFFKELEKWNIYIDINNYLNDNRLDYWMKEEINNKTKLLLNKKFEINWLLDNIFKNVWYNFERFYNIIQLIYENTKWEEIKQEIKEFFLDKYDKNQKMFLFDDESAEPFHVYIEKIINFLFKDKYTYIFSNMTNHWVHKKWKLNNKKEIQNKIIEIIYKSIIEINEYIEKDLKFFVNNLIKNTKKNNLNDALEKNKFFFKIIYNFEKDIKSSQLFNYLFYLENSNYNTEKNESYKIYENLYIFNYFLYYFLDRLRNYDDGQIIDKFLYTKVIESLRKAIKYKKIINEYDEHYNYNKWLAMIFNMYL